MEEVFLDIEGFEGLYQVSNLGNVKSLNYNKTKKEKILKPFINNNGYLLVNLHKKYKKKTYLVHRLVAQTFIENTNNYSFVNHKDECRTNNVVTNLEWCTHKYNCNYGTRNERVGKSLTNNPKRSKAMKNNPKISKSVGAFKYGELVFTFPSTNEAQRQGFNQGNVAACCRGKLQHYKGFEWRYI